MANVDPIFLATPKTVGVTITAADTTTKIPAFTASTDGGAVTTLSACSFDASDVVVVLSFNDGLASYQLGEVTVPAGSGTNGTALPVDLLAAVNIPAVDSDGSFLLTALGALEVAAKVTVGGNVDISGIAGDY